MGEDRYLIGVFLDGRVCPVDCILTILRWSDGIYGIYDVEGIIINIWGIMVKYNFLLPSDESILQII